MSPAPPEGIAPGEFMQQRRVRLGDILDDYCPRERRITNHAVVAMIEDEVKQTRCTTCDADHEYKHAKVPAPRRKKSDGALASDVSEAAIARAVPDLPDPVPDSIQEDPTTDALLENAAPLDDAGGIDNPGPLSEPESESEPEPGATSDDEWPVHRPLIRATLPRPDGQTPERKAPDFTIRQNGRFDAQRNGNNRRRGHRQAQGHSSGQPRFGNPRSGSGSGSGHGHGQQSGHGQRKGNRPGQPGGQRGGGRPAGHGRGPRPGQSRGPKRGR